MTVGMSILQIVWWSMDVLFFVSCILVRLGVLVLVVLLVIVKQDNAREPVKQVVRFGHVKLEEPREEGSVQVTVRLCARTHVRFSVRGAVRQCARERGVRMLTVRVRELPRN